MIERPDNLFTYLTHKHANGLVLYNRIAEWSKDGIICLHHLCINMPMVLYNRITERSKDRMICSHTWCIKMPIVLQSDCRMIERPDNLFMHKHANGSTIGLHTGNQNKYTCLLDDLSKWRKGYPQKRNRTLPIDKRDQHCIFQRNGALCYSRASS